jgi:ribosomal protein S18 acetylase RimI-like enzyme
MRDETSQIVEALPKSLCDQAGELLATAFCDNPAHAFIFPKTDKRHEALAWLMRRNIAAQAEVGQSFSILNSDKTTILMMAFWHPPRGAKVDTGVMLKHGLLEFPVRFGLSATSRLLRVITTTSQAREAATEGHDAWHLNNMVVAKNVRGQGLGGRVLHQQLTDVVAPSGYPAVLETQREENVRFYKRLGFEVVSLTKIDATTHSFPSWCMIWNPKKQ